MSEEFIADEDIDSHEKIDFSGKYTTGFSKEMSVVFDVDSEKAEHVARVLLGGKMAIKGKNTYLTQGEFVMELLNRAGLMQKGSITKRLGFGEIGELEIHLVKSLWSRDIGELRGFVSSCYSNGLRKPYGGVFPGDGKKEAPEGPGTDAAHEPVRGEAQEDRGIIGQLKELLVIDCEAPARDDAKGIRTEAEIMRETSSSIRNPDSLRYNEKPVRKPVAAAPSHKDYGLKKVTRNLLESAGFELREILDVPIYEGDWGIYKTLSGVVARYFRLDLDDVNQVVNNVAHSPDVVKIKNKGEMTLRSILERTGNRKGFRERHPELEELGIEFVTGGHGGTRRRKKPDVKKPEMEYVPPAEEADSKSRDTVRISDIYEIAEEVGGDFGKTFIVLNTAISELGGDKDGVDREALVEKIGEYMNGKSESLRVDEKTFDRLCEVLSENGSDDEAGYDETERSDAGTDERGFNTDVIDIGKYRGAIISEGDFVKMIGWTARKCDGTTVLFREFEDYLKENGSVGVDEILEFLKEEGDELSRWVCKWLDKNPDGISYVEEETDVDKVIEQDVPDALHPYGRGDGVSGFDYVSGADPKYMMLIEKEPFRGMEETGIEHVTGVLNERMASDTQLTCHEVGYVMSELGLVDGAGNVKLGGAEEMEDDIKEGLERIRAMRFGDYSIVGKNTLLNVNDGRVYTKSGKSWHCDGRLVKITKENRDSSIEEIFNGHAVSVGGVVYSHAVEYHGGREVSVIRVHEDDVFDKYMEGETGFDGVRSVFSREFQRHYKSFKLAEEVYG